MKKTKKSPPKVILFVCFGNICRSPAAEAVMNKLIEKEGLMDFIICDSAGTSQHHAGRPADPTMTKYAREKGYSITSISRAFEVGDFDRSDWIITMDNFNHKDIMSLAKTKEQKEKILKMADFCNIKNCDFIPDPYCQEKEKFMNVISLLEDSCSHLLDKIKTTLL